MALTSLQVTLPSKFDPESDTLILVLDPSLTVTRSDRLPVVGARDHYTVTLEIEKADTPADGLDERLLARALWFEGLADTDESAATTATALLGAMDGLRKHALALTQEPRSGDDR